MLLIVLVSLAGGSGGAWAQGAQPRITVTARAGYGDTGTYLIGAWVPVRVTLTNPAGGASYRVRVQVESKGADDNAVTGIYGREVDLPGSSRKEVAIYAYAGGYTRKFRVQVLQDSTSIASVDVAADPYEPPANMIVGVSSSDPSLLNILKGEGLGHIVNSLPQGGYGGYSGPYQTYAQTNGNGSATVAHIKLDDIPAMSRALDSLGAIILSDVDTGTLNDEQRASLEGWVSRGGSLVAAVGVGGVDTTSGIAGLLPVTVAGTRTLSSLNSLGDLVATPLAVAGPVAVGDARLRADVAASSRVLAQQDGVPLVAVRDYGEGHIIYLGVSPGTAPLKNWDGMLPLMKRLLADHPLRLTYGAFLRFSPSRGYYMGSLYSTYGGMFSIPNLNLPSAWLIGFFLLLYIIIVGPVNFIVLRRMRRTELAWITVPVLVGLFSLVAYLLAFQAKGGELLAIRANVVNSYEGVEQASMAQHFGLFSPIRRTYTLSIPADSLITEMNAYGYYQAGSDNPSPVLGGNRTTINNVNINTWSLKAYLAEHTAKAQSPIETKLHLGDNVIIGTIKNRTSGPLQDVALVRGEAVKSVGYLAPGQQTEVRLAVSSRRFNNQSPSGLLPPPAGVSPPGPGMSYPYNGGQGNTTEQRTYNRKVEVLSAALYPLLGDTPPTDMSVIVLAWGPSLPVSFDVEGHSTNSEELNLWADVAPVVAVGSEQPKLSRGTVPYTVYAPGTTSSSPWMAWNGGDTLPGSSSGLPGGVPTAVPGVPTVAPQLPSGSIVPTPAPSFIGQPVIAQGIKIAPYADVQYSLPAGTQPASLTFNYSIDQLVADGDIDLLAYNVGQGQGKWDKIGSWKSNTIGQVASSRGNMDIPNPAQYVSPDGIVTLRLQVRGKEATLTNATLGMALNDK